jgi:hypothetical protein
LVEDLGKFGVDHRRGHSQPLKDYQAGLTTRLGQSNEKVFGLDHVAV